MRARGSYTSASCASHAAPSPHAHMRACRAPHAGDLARVACASSKQAVSTRRFAPRSNSGFEAFMDRPGKPGWIANASASPHGRSAMALSLHNNDSPCGHPLPRRPLTCAQGRCLGPRERSALAAPRPRPRRGRGGALVPAQASPMSPALATQTSLRPRIAFTVAGSIGAGTLFLEYLRR